MRPRASAKRTDELEAVVIPRGIATTAAPPSGSLESPPPRPLDGTVEVRFIAETTSATRRLEHRHLDRHGEGWEGARDGGAAPDGWGLYLSRYADLV
jgi:uncharacterized protein YndB with AHSA1/START domain